MELTDDASAQADLFLRAGRVAGRAGDSELAGRHLRAAGQAYGELGDTSGQARAQASLARIDHAEGRLDEASERLGRALEALDPAISPREHARLSSERARHLFFLGRTEEARDQVAVALDLAEREGLLDVVADALLTRCLILEHDGHGEEAFALLRHGYELAREHASGYVLDRAANNLSLVLAARARWDEVYEVLEGALHRAPAGEPGYRAELPRLPRAHRPRRR